MAVLKMHKSTISGLPTDLANLSSQISVETTNRTSADNALSARIDALVTSVNENKNQTLISFSNVETQLNQHSNLLSQLTNNLNAAKVEAKNYTDSTAAALTTAYREYADQADIVVLNSTKSYTDMKEKLLSRLLIKLTLTKLELIPLILQSLTLIQPPIHYLLVLQQN